MLSLRFAHRCVVVVVCAALLPATLVAGKNFVKPVARTAINYPAHDFHRDEQVAIAADPYDTPEKAKIFSVDFAAHGFLPVFFVVTNDGEQPVSIGNMQVKIVVTGTHIDDIVTVQKSNRPGSVATTLRAQALSAQSSNVGNVSGATFSSTAYKQSLQSAIAKI